MCHATRVFRDKMVANHVNPALELLLQVVVLVGAPFLWLFGLFHDHIMMKFLNKTYIYNVSWEDPRMDQRVFHLNGEDHVITIASAGCNALDYIIEGAQVTAVDFNLCQIALTELKAVSIQQLDYEEFFEIFSRSNMGLLRARYHEKLRMHLSPKSAEFWDRGVHEIKSFMYSGTSGQMAGFLFRTLFPLLGLGFVRQCILNNASAEEFHAELNKRQYQLRTLAWILDNLAIRGGCVFAGVPKRQMELGMHRPNNLAIVIDKVFFNSDLVNDNYFFAGYILGEYTKKNCPRYLRKEHYETMRQNLAAGKLKLFHGTINDAIEQTTTPITVASLLDHMDWMTDRQINQEITLLMRKMDHEKGRIFWRSFADEVHSAPLFFLNAEKVDDHDDRVPMYFSTWIAHLRNVSFAYEDRIDSWGATQRSALSLLVTGAKIVTFPLWQELARKRMSAQGHAKDMEAFYKFQKDGYDEFREGLLHARPALMESFPLKKEGGMVWIDVGGGTARNLEYLPVAVIRKYFSKIYILDVSTSLLEMAQKRINAMGLSDIVSVVEHDFTADSVFKHLPKQGSVDIITMSYSLSMIPDKKQALVNASKLLKDNGEGILAVADFFLHGNHDDALPPTQAAFRAWESDFHRWWFANDKVFLLDEKLFDCVNGTLSNIWDKRFRGAVPFLPMLQPFHGVYMLSKGNEARGN